MERFSSSALGDTVAICNSINVMTTPSRRKCGLIIQHLRVTASAHFSKLLTAKKMKCNGGENGDGGMGWSSSVLMLQFLHGHGHEW